jgi:hypothetical protein
MTVDDKRAVSTLRTLATAVEHAIEDIEDGSVGWMS